MSNELFVCRKILPITRHENCNCTLECLITSFGYNNPRNCSALVMMVSRGDLEALKRHIDANREMRIIDKYWNSPLHLSVIFNKTEIFDYLMTVKTVNVNASNCYGQTSLHLSIINKSDYYFTQLIKRGADVNLADDSRCTPLHVAATKFCPEMFDTLIEHGANINAQNLLGKTALYHACQYGTVDSVYMLLYYGATCNITDFYKILPFTAAMQQVLKNNEVTQAHFDCHEVLFYHTFEKEKVNVSLSAITVALRIKSPLFREIMRKVDHVNYSNYDLMELCRTAKDLDQKSFKTLVRRYPYIIREMLLNPSDLYYDMKLSPYADPLIVKLMDFLTMLFEYRPRFNFVKGSMNFTYFITVLATLYRDGRLSMEMMKQMIYFLYSYGLPCELIHIITIYENCGFCEILKFALDLDMIVTFERPKAVMPYLIADINLTIDKFIDYVRHPCKQYRSALKFFMRPKVWNFFATKPGFRKKLVKINQVPSLIEYARDVARKHIIDTFQIKRTRDFYRLLKKMPINDVYKKILTYERELYRF